MGDIWGDKVREASWPQGIEDFSQQSCFVNNATQVPVPNGPGTCGAVHSQGCFIEMCLKRSPAQGSFLPCLGRLVSNTGFQSETLVQVPKQLLSRQGSFLQTCCPKSLAPKQFQNGPQKNEKSGPFGLPARRLALKQPKRKLYTVTWFGANRYVTAFRKLRCFDKPSPSSSRASRAQASAI